MAEPVTTVAGGWAGIKIAPLVAGFAGAVVSLSYVRQLNRWQMCMALASGALCAAYLTPFVRHFTNFPAELENGIAFLVGVSAMNLVPGMIKLSERFRDTPERYVRLPGEGRE